jgi:hypothetical protein
VIDLDKILPKVKSPSGARSETEVAAKAAEVRALREIVAFTREYRDRVVDIEQYITNQKNIHAEGSGSWQAYNALLKHVTNERAAIQKVIDETLDDPRIKAIAG